MRPGFIARSVPPSQDTHHNLFVATLIITAVLVLLGCGLMAAISILQPPPTEQQVSAIRARHPAFNLEETTPNADAAALEATQEAQLSSYGWADKDKQIAGIAIERAMELISGQSAEATATPPS